MLSFLKTKYKIRKTNTGYFVPMHKKFWMCIYKDINNWMRYPTYHSALRFINRSGGHL